MYKKNYDQADVHKINREAVIMERFTSSPRILNVYGYCGTSVLVESMDVDIHRNIVLGEGSISQKKLDEYKDVMPLNNLTASEKLQISLSMAESLQDLHEFEGGVIVHSDIDNEQWLLGSEKTLKLNDFNNAYVMQWNSKKQSYCYRYAEFGGTYRAPEEYEGQAQDETKDVYGFGNNMYTLLTGLYPYYDEIFQYETAAVKDEDFTDNLEDEIVKGKRPFIDDRYRTRSYIESMLVKVMETCWAGNRNDRPSMAFVVDFLQKVKLQALKNGELEPSNLINIPIPES